MGALITKIVTWVLANGATLLGILQSLVKAVKELLTGVINLISLILSKEIAASWVDAVRNALNAIDEVIEKLKGYLLK
jgi:phage-related protein